MRLLGAIVASASLAAAFPLPAGAAGGFGAPSVVGAGQVFAGGIVAPPVAAANARGHAALAWLDGSRVRVARHAPGVTWTAQALSAPADWFEDVELVVTPDGDTVVAWTETHADEVPGLGVVKGGVPDWFRVAVAPAGRPFGPAQVVAKGSRADSALPRLAALGDGRVMLVWRAAREPRGGELLMAFLGSDHRFGRSRRLGFDGIAPAVTATSDGGAVVTWAGTARRGTPRRLLAARLPARGHRLQRAFEITRSAGERGARLAAGPDGVVMASWASQSRPRRLLAAQITPARGPDRILRAGRAGPLALGPGGSVLVTDFAPSKLRPPGSGAPGSFDEGPGLWVTGGTVARGFGARVELPTSLSPVSAASAILPTGEALVAWLQQDSSVLVASRPGGSRAFGPAEALGVARQDAFRGLPLTLAQAGAHVLVAWPGPSPRGGMIVAERR